MSMFTGTVKSMTEAYGFIDCAEVRAAYNRDAFMHADKLPEGVFGLLQAGMAVRFDIQVDKKNQPQVTNLTPVGAAPQYVPAAHLMAPAPPQLAAVPAVVASPTGRRATRR